MHALFIVLVILCIVVSLIYSTKKPKDYPPGPKWYPIVGSLPQLKKMVKKCGNLNLAIEEFSKIYNSNVIGLKLGGNLVIVVLSYPLIKQVLLDGNYLGRPSNFFMKLRTMGSIKGITSTEGEFWLTQRNFVIKHLRNIGFGKKIMDKKIQGEAQEIIKIIELNKGSVKFYDLLSPSVLNVLWSLAAGTEINRNDKRLIKLLDILSIRTRAFDMSGSTLNYFPWLRFIAPERTGYNLIKSLNFELKKLLMETINEHIDSWAEGRNDDLIYAYISEINEANGNLTTFSHDQLLMVCLDLFIAGSTTTSSTLDFVFLSMILYPDVQAKCHKILDETFSKDHVMEYTDKHKVPYIEAVIMEVERYFTILPIIGPRRPMGEAILEGYQIPQDSSILIYSDSINKSSECFPKPREFKPERFLNENNEIINKEPLLTFGLGKRRCLGDALAKNCIYVFFTEILRNYEIRSPPGHPKPSDQPVPGITMSPQEYSVQLKRRL